MSNMTRSNPSRENEGKNLRNSRVEDRDEGLTITLPDGRKITRRPTEFIGEQGLKLFAPKKEGYFRYWASDQYDHRIQELINFGFTPATDENGVQLAPRRGGTKANGSSWNYFLMEIPEKEYEELLRKNEELNPSLKARKIQNDFLAGAKAVDGLDVYQPTPNTIKILS